ncbi:MAG: FAD-binding oxidoreductase [Pseudomonadota bacterium]
MSSQTLPEGYDIAIVGAGIVGCSTALFLARQGRRVAVFDRGGVSGEQSSRAWGFIRQQGRHPAEIPLATEAQKLWNGITEEFGADGTHYVREGILVPAQSAADEDLVNRNFAAAQDSGLKTVILSSRELAGKLPDLQGEWRCALYTPDDGHCEPPTSTLTVAKAARAAGADILLNQLVTGFMMQNGQLHGLITRAGAVRANTIVIAGGIGSRMLLKQLGYNFPVQIIRSSVARTSPVQPFTKLAMWGPKVSFRPRPDGSFTIGNGYRGVGTDYDLTLESLSNLRYFLPAFRRNYRLLRLTVGSDLARSFTDLFSGSQKYEALQEPPVNSRKIEANLAEFRKMFPRVGALALAECWAGRLDITPDLIPIIDRMTKHGNLFVACGFSGHGFALGPVVGQQLCRWITEGAPSIDLSKFCHARFANGDFELIKAI